MSMLLRLKGSTKMAAVFVIIAATLLLLAGTSLAADCALQVGYWASPNYVVNANNMKNYTDFSVAIKDCDANQFCFGVSKIQNQTVFTTKGSAATAVLVPTGTAEVCLYQKLTTRCNAQPGYSVIVDVDSQGTTMTSYANPTATRKACDSNVACLGFTSKLVTKSSLTPFVYSRGSCLYAKIPTVCPAIDGYTATADINFAGSLPATGINASNALAACNSRSDCSGFSSNAAAGTGELEAYTWTNTSMQYSRGSCYYKKNSDTSCPTIPGYNANVDTDTVPGTFSDNGTTNDVMESWTAATLCWDELSCAGFIKTASGWTRRGPPSLTTAYSYRKCWYSKKSSEATCTSVPGYTTVADREPSQGVANPSGHPIWACDSQEDCQAFSPSLNSTQNGTIDTTASPGNCTYYKSNDTNCPDTLLWFTPMNDTGLEGCSSQNPVTFATTASDCKAITACAGFTIRADTSSLKMNESSGYYVYSYRQCFYKRKPNAVCSAVTGYTKIGDYDTDPDLRFAYGLADPYGQCNSNINCGAYSTTSASIAPNATKETPGACSYAKIPGYIPPVCNVSYRGFYRNDTMVGLPTRIDGTNARFANYYANVSQAREVCYLDDNCVAFDSQGYLYYKGPQTTYLYMGCIWIGNSGLNPDGTRRRLMGSGRVGARALP